MLARDDSRQKTKRRLLSTNWHRFTPHDSGLNISADSHNHNASQSKKDAFGCSLCGCASLFEWKCFGDLRTAKRLETTANKKSRIALISRTDPATTGHCVLRPVTIQRSCSNPILDLAQLRDSRRRWPLPEGSMPRQQHVQAVQLLLVSVCQA